MPAKDLFHEKVKTALLKDGWTITHDPLTLRYEPRYIQIDLAAERLIAAEKATQKIAVEIKGFDSSSQVAALENALGQYILYRDILEEIEPERTLYLAIPGDAENGIFSEAMGALIIRKNNIHRIVYHPELEEIIAWKF